MSLCCFEDHLQACASCRAELRAHQLFVCELDAVLTDSLEIPVPANFSRMVAARASSDMSGVRTRSENRKALSICVILALAGFALLGATARDAIFMLGEEVSCDFLGRRWFCVDCVYDTVAGLAVIFRVVSRKVIIESGSVGSVAGSARSCRFRTLALDLKLPSHGRNRVRGLRLAMVICSLTSQSRNIIKCSFKKYRIIALFAVVAAAHGRGQCPKRQLKKLC